jgi:hypothetical protein
VINQSCLLNPSPFFFHSLIMIHNILGNIWFSRGRLGFFWNMFFDNKKNPLLIWQKIFGIHQETTRYCVNRNYHLFSVLVHLDNMSTLLDRWLWKGMSKIKGTTTWLSVGWGGYLSTANFCLFVYHPLS